MNEVWGRQAKAPKYALVSWGARAIYHLNFHEKMKGTRKNPGHRAYTSVDLDLVYKSISDEFSDFAPDLYDWLNNIGLKELKKLLTERCLDRMSREVVEFNDGLFHIEASPQGSGGYMYIGAWLLDEPKNHYRCTRPKVYDHPNIPGAQKLGERQGHYVNAYDAEDAGKRIAADFPGEVIDVQAWGAPEGKSGQHVGYWNDHLQIWRGIAP